MSDHTAWMPVDIRAAVPDDLDAIAAVDTAAWRQHDAPHVPPEVAEAWLARIPYAWRRSFRDGRADFVVRVAATDGAVIGFVALERARLWALQVDPAFDDRGIAEALFADARALCGPGLYLHALAANRRAHAFWKRQGLRVAAEMKDVFLDAEIPTCIYTY